MLSPFRRQFTSITRTYKLPYKVRIPISVNRLRSSTTNMSTSSVPAQGTSTTHFPSSSSTPGEQFEARQTHPSEDYTPDPSKSLPLSPARQALVDDIIALYSCEPTIKRVERYTPDCVYDDQFVYANDRYKMAGQWFALPKLFKKSTNNGYQIVVNDRDLIQFRNAQVLSFLFLSSPITNSTSPLQFIPSPSHFHLVRPL